MKGGFNNEEAFLNFLNHLGLNDYANNFTGDILNQDILDINENMLDEIGIQKLHYRKRFVRNVKKLEEKEIKMINKFFKEKAIRESQTKIELPEGATYREPYTHIVDSRWKGGKRKRKRKSKGKRKKKKTIKRKKKKTKSKNK